MFVALQHINRQSVRLRHYLHCRNFAWEFRAFVKKAAGGWLLQNQKMEFRDLVRCFQTESSATGNVGFCTL